MCGGWCLSRLGASRLLWSSIVLPRYAFSGIRPNDVLTLEAAEAISIGNQRNGVGGVCLFRRCRLLLVRLFRSCPAFSVRSPYCIYLLS